MTQSSPTQIRTFPTDRKALCNLLLESVEKIRPIVARHKNNSENRRQLAPEVVAAMRDSNLLMMKSPREVGGAEIHPVDQMTIVEAVTMVDSAAAWSMFITATVSGRALSALSDRALEDILGSGKFPIMAGSLKPGGSAVEVEGGYRITGQWAWGSGVHQADYVVVPALKADKSGLVTAVVPREQVQVIDNWHALGINGSGSSDYALDAVFVPDHFAITTPGRLRGGAIYNMGYGFASNEHAVFALALGQLALQTLTESAVEKKRGYGAGVSIADREIFQRTVAEGELRLRACKLLIVDVLERLFDASQEQEAPIALQAEARAASVLCTDEAIAVTSALFRYAGGSAVMLDHPMQRILRDLYTAQSHLMVSDAAYESLGKLRLGLTDVAPLR